MSKAKKLSCVLFVTVFLILSICFSVQGIIANANETTTESETVVENEQATTRGWFTSLVVGFEGGNGYITPYVRNEFTLFPATIVVVLDLYYSDTYQGQDMAMTWVHSVSTPDLNMGEKLSFSYPTGGVERYWKARAVYRMDGNDEQTITSSIVRVSATGEFLGYL